MKSLRNVATLALCTTLALGAVSLGSVAFAADDMPAKSDQPVTDTWITTKVKTELATTEGVKSTKISVTTKDGDRGAGRRSRDEQRGRQGDRRDRKASRA